MARTISLTEITHIISEECGVSIQCAEQMIASFIDQITDAVMVGNKVNISDFGVFRPIMSRITQDKKKRCTKVVFTQASPLSALLISGER